MQVRGDGEVLLSCGGLLCTNSRPNSQEAGWLLDARGPERAYPIGPKDQPIA